MVAKQKTLADMKVGSNDFAKLQAERQNEQSKQSQSGDPEERIRVKILKRGTVLNGHHLRGNTIVQLTRNEIDIMRERGIQLGPLDESDEDREVFDHSQAAEGVEEGKKVQLVGGPSAK